MMEEMDNFARDCRAGLLTLFKVEMLENRRE